MIAPYCNQRRFRKTFVTTLFLAFPSYFRTDLIFSVVFIYNKYPLMDFYKKSAPTEVNAQKRKLRLPLNKFYDRYELLYSHKWNLHF